jgi:putative transcriptional regulator
MTTKKPSRLTTELLEMAETLHRLGIMDDATCHKITVRHLGDKAMITAEPISGEEIRTLRERRISAKPSLPGISI